MLLRTNFRTVNINDVAGYYSTALNRCSKPSAVYSTIDYSKLHETASAAYRRASFGGQTDR